jgi:hypothetical protein
MLNFDSADFAVLRHTFEPLPSGPGRRTETFANGPHCRMVRWGERGRESGREKVGGKRPSPTGRTAGWCDRERGREEEERGGERRWAERDLRQRAGWYDEERGGEGGGGGGERERRQAGMRTEESEREAAGGHVH